MSNPAKSRLPIIMSVGLTLMVIMAAVSFLIPEPHKLERMATPVPMDYDWELATLAGSDVDLQQYRGKWLFLNIWATWCPPCVEEMPSIERLHATMEPRGVAFLAVSVDEEPDDVREFVKRNRMQVPVALAEGYLPDSVYTESIPATFIISPNGQVVFRLIGYNDWASKETLAFLEQLMAGGS